MSSPIVAAVSRWYACAARPDVSGAAETAQRWVGPGGENPPTSARSPAGGRRSATAGGSGARAPRRVIALTPHDAAARRSFPRRLVGLRALLRPAADPLDRLVDHRVALGKREAQQRPRRARRVGGERRG